LASSFKISKQAGIRPTVKQSATLRIDKERYITSAKATYPYITQQFLNFTLP